MIPRSFCILLVLILATTSGSALAGDWNYAASMSTPRHKHTATLLDHGELLVTGGGYSSGGWTVTSACDLYDPAAGDWSPADSMHEKREWHTATMLWDGTVLVTGGFGGFEYPVSCEIYDPESDTWEFTDPLSVRREGHTATMLLDGRLLVAGGGPYISSCEIYDPSSSTWTSTGSLQTPRYGHTATLLGDGRVLLTGGFCPGVSITASCEIYNPGTGSWSETDSMNTNREGHTAIMLPDGRVLVIGGYGYAGEDLATFATCEVFDQLTETWSYIDSMSGDRQGHTATLLPDNTLLVAGGSHYDGSFWDVLSSCEIYDLTAETWREIESMNSERTYLTATLLPNGKLLAVGGTNDTSCEIYAPSAGVEDMAGEEAGEHPSPCRICPNPFRSSTVIRYCSRSECARRVRVSLKVYDVTGNLVRTLVDGYEDVGWQTTRWGGRDNAGRRVSAGVYFAVLVTGNGGHTKKLVISR